MTTHAAGIGTVAPVRTRDRAVTAFAFPVATWVAWRTAHLLAVLAWGGDPVGATFRFDGAWMRSVVDQGYVLSDPSYSVHQNVAFLPGLPAVTRLVATAVGTEAAGVIVANAFGLAAFCALFAAARAVSDVTVARRAVVALALWPGSLALWAFMSEGAFITTSALAVLADTKRRPGLAALAAWAAGTLRVVGFTVGPALALARVIRLRRVDRVATLYAASGAASLATVVVVQQVAVGDGLAFSRAQAAWDRGVTMPGTVLPSALRHVVEALPHVSSEVLMNVASVAVVTVALAVATMRLGLRGRESGALVVGWAALLVPLCTTLVSSQVRYVMGAWAAVLVVGCIPHRSRSLQILAAVVGVVVTLVLSHRWVTGGFVA